MRIVGEVRTSFGAGRTFGRGSGVLLSRWDSLVVGCCCCCCCYREMERMELLRSMASWVCYLGRLLGNGDSYWSSRHETAVKSYGESRMYLLSLSRGAQGLKAVSQLLVLESDRVPARQGDIHMVEMVAEMCCPTPDGKIEYCRRSGRKNRVSYSQSQTGISVPLRLAAVLARVERNLRARPHYHIPTRCHEEPSGRYEGDLL